jgi:hypothetical protein
VTQLWSITPQPVGYLSKELDQVAKRWPVSLRAVATVSLLVPEAQKLILNHPLTVYTPHKLGGVLNSKGELGYLTVIYLNTRPSFWEKQK